MAVDVTLPKGTRDFLPRQMIKRNFIFDTLRDVFNLYGYQQIETPAMENLSTLLGKYGEEGDKLLFRLLNSGNFIKDVAPNDIDTNKLGELANKLTEKGLKYDLTVPFARFVVMHKNEITIPFKRYQMQPVWRADRPQKGRYREFYQCDVDIIGTDSLLNEFELLQIIDEVFKRFNLSVTVKLNNRKILAGMAELIGYPEKLTSITVALDKIDKIGKDKVIQELNEVGINSDACTKLFDFIIDNNLKSPETILNNIDVDSTPNQLIDGLNELNFIYSIIKNTSFNCSINFDLTLARGLSYYTGTILEVISDEVAMGSICGGGRYDDLTGIFGLSGLSGVGMSFGAERIYDVLEALNKFPVQKPSQTVVMIANFSENDINRYIELANILRNKSISTEIYPDFGAKFKKQFSYANNNDIPFVVIIGEDEIINNTVSVKNMVSGEQVSVSSENIVLHIENYFK